LHFSVFAFAVAFAFNRLRKGPFEGPATVKPPALPEDSYSVSIAAAVHHEVPSKGQYHLQVQLLIRPK
jgi:hypothetical protein